MSAGDSCTHMFLWKRTDRMLYRIKHFSGCVDTLTAGQKMITVYLLGEVTKMLMWAYRICKDRWQIKRKTNVRCLSKGVGPPCVARTALAVIHKVCGTLLDGCNTVLPKDIPLFGVSTMWRRAQRMVQHLQEVSHSSNLSVNLLWPMDGCIVILEEIAPIRIEMLHHRIKAVTQNIAAFIWLTLSDSFLEGDKWTHIMPEKMPPPHSITEPQDPLTLGVKLSRPAVLLVCTTHALAHLSRILWKMTHLTALLFSTSLWTSANVVSLLNSQMCI